MCTGVEIALIAGAAVSAGTAIHAGEQQRSAANAAADQAKADAETAAGQAQVEAAKIREAAKRQRSAAIAALSASGVDVGAGTAEQITADITQRGEEDALTTILTGSNRGRMLNREAEISRIGGSNAATAGYVGAASSVLGSAGNYYTWKNRK